jgi:hypothetical protein
MIKGIAAHRRGSLILALALAPLAGCIDLVPVGPPPERPAVLNLFLRVDEDLTDDGPPVVPVAVTAMLDLGVDRDGLPREFGDFALTVAGHELGPTGVDQVGRIGWGATIGVARESLLDGTLEVRTPIMKPGTAPEFTIRWPLLVRTGPEAFEVPAGTSARLGVEFVNLSGAPLPDATRWSLAVFGAAGWFSRGGDGPPPAEVVFPVDDVGGPGSGLLAILSQSRSFEISTAHGEYLVRTELSQETRWSVSVTGDP